MHPSSYREPELDLKDVQIQTARGSGKGGQHRNKTDSCVVTTHIPTGIQARVDGRDQHSNKREALALLSKRVAERDRLKHDRTRRSERWSQVGSGMRGDKVRTYRAADDRVVDHRLNRTWRLKKWLRGDWS